MQNYEVAPNMISGKDLDYLSDVYNWNFNSCELSNDFLDKVSDEEINDLFKKASDLHINHCKEVLNILR